MGSTRKTAPKTCMTVGMAADELRKVRQALTIIIRRLDEEDRRKMLISARDPRMIKACPMVTGVCEAPVWDKRIKTVTAEIVAEGVEMVLPCLNRLLRSLEY